MTNCPNLGQHPQVFGLAEELAEQVRSASSNTVTKPQHCLSPLTHVTICQYFSHIHLKHLTKENIHLKNKQTNKIH